METRTAPPRVLVIDDEDGIRHILRVSLESAGYQVIDADDGLRGVGMARRQRPDAIVLDLMMPVMDGLSVLDHLRADDRTRDVPVVVLTALLRAEDREAATAGGAARYITKPFDPADVASALEELIA